MQKMVWHLFFATVFAFAVWGCRDDSNVLTGIDVLIEQNMEVLAGKRVGLITNPTGVTRTLSSTVDVLYQHSEVNLVALFGPEHGVRGDFAGGEKISHMVDEKTGITMFSLYGKTMKPTLEMLGNIDILVFDIQDIGCRSYTYISTMAYAMQAAKEHNIAFVVLDRPNPLGGVLVEGPMLDMDYRSNIGYYPIAYVHGMTVGELAGFFNQEYEIDADLTVVEMKGWKRNMVFEDTGLTWLPTSPHIPHAITAFYYPTTGIVGELNTINIGVGYTIPFELVAAPWMDATALAEEMDSRELPAVKFRPIYFKPFYYHFANQPIQGVHVHILDQKHFEPIRTQVHLLSAMIKLFPENDIFATHRISSFDKAAGSDELRSMLKAQIPPDKIIQSWHEELQNFKQTREKYLIYE
jgi:uncharacterized protein YbbC (DUF1343 family)